MTRTFIHTTLMILGLLSFGFSAQAMNGGEPDQYVSVRIITDKTSVQAGDTIRLGLVQNIHPKWHTYWINPGDSGTPTSIHWNLPKDFSTTALEWPTPLKIPFGPLTNYGYEGQSILLQTLKIPDSFDDSQPITLTGRVDLLVCHDICIPESHPVSITLNGKAPASPEEIQNAELQIPQEVTATASIEENGGDIIFNTANLNTLVGNNFFIAPEEWGVIDNTAKSSANGNSIVQKRGDRDWTDIPNATRYIIVDNDTKESFAFTATKKETAATASATAPSNKSITPLKAIIFAFLGGLILNLMPCVFPVLSMKALSLVKLGKTEEKKARQHGISYTMGVLLSFGVIAGALLILKSTGAQIGWGFHLQSPIIISFLIYLIFIIGLNLLGIFEFANPFANTGQKLTQSDGNKGAFFTGILATLVATPCTAPFMGAAMGFALTQPTIISMSVFLSLGLGLAAPYLALCFSPALRNKLPKPGAWMEKFKELLAFPMFLTAAWLTWVLAQQSNEASIFYLLVSLTLIGFVFWSRKSASGKGILKYISRAVNIIALIFIITIPFLLTPKTPVEKSQAHSEEFSLSKLDEALQGDQAIFTNMTAAWCITCKVNERIALKTDAVQSAFDKHNITFMVGDWTNKEPEITEYLTSFGRSGVPLYVFYPPRNIETGERAKPIVLPQILTPAIVLKSLSKGLEL